MIPEADSFADLQSLLDTLCEADATPRELSRLETLVLADPEACAYYVRYMQLHGALHLSAMPFNASPDFSRVLAPARTEHPLDNNTYSNRIARVAKNGSSAPVPRSIVRGFLRGLVRKQDDSARDMPAASALMWLTMALLCSGMVLSLFLCIVLVCHELGASGRANTFADTTHADGNAILPKSAKTRQAATNEHDGVWPDERIAAEPAPPTGVASRSSVASVARLIHANDCSWAIGSHSPNLGDDLLPGRKLVLRSGLAEVMFQTGVRALLEGPATLEIVSGRSARLFQGKVTVRIEDPDAAGFEVHAPGMKYTDLGTEFGVSVAKDGTQIMAVFRGQVRAEQEMALSGPAKASAAERGKSQTNASGLPMVLTANHAIHVFGTDNSANKDDNPGKDTNPSRIAAKRIERIGVDEKLFVRSSPGPEPFAIYGTGVGVGRGAADKHWEIVAVSTDPNFKPRPARIVLRPIHTYVSDSRDEGQWVSLTAQNDSYPEGCRWTFRTKFDLTGFDPNTARIEGQFAVDNFIAEVRLNGRRLPLDDTGDFTKYHSISIDRAFLSGVNTLDIVIVNGYGGAQMGLCVDWKGAARRLSLRD